MQPKGIEQLQWCAVWGHRSRSGLRMLLALLATSLLAGCASSKIATLYSGPLQPQRTVALFIKGHWNRINERTAVCGVAHRIDGIRTSTSRYVELTPGSHEAHVSMCGGGIRTKSGYISFNSHKSVHTRFHAKAGYVYYPVVTIDKQNRRWSAHIDGVSRQNVQSIKLSRDLQRYEGYRKRGRYWNARRN